MAVKRFFISGTDTGIGKTRSTLYLMQALQAAGLSVAGLKPVASGAEWRDGLLVNDDALALQAAASTSLPYALVNPFVFEPPVSPHIAAALAGRAINFAAIAENCEKAAEFADIVLVEGVGGWKAPLSERETVADLARFLGFPVVLVVGLRLGCLSHAALTRDALVSSGLPFAGWIGNQVVRDFPYVDENLRTLHSIFGCPPLGRIPFREGPDLPGNGEFRQLAVEPILRAQSAYDKFAP
jgi:dethiobiotin synthetase